MTYLRHLSCLVALAMLSACGSKTEEVPAQAAPKPVAQQSKPAPAEVDPVEKMPRAVGNGKPGAAADIKYEFAAKPEVGKPVELQVALIASAGVDSMQATFTGMDGLTLAGDLTVTVNKAQAGEAFKHSISVLADRAGVYYVTAVVSTEISGVTLSRTYAIPFVAGAVTQQKVQAPPETDAQGQPVEPMKAKEEVSGD
jgi:hypothetical protein